jgi:putative holliday junction resolvase
MTTATAGSPRSLLAIDFGLRRIGIATAVLITRTASPLTTLPAADGEPEWGKLDSLVKEWQPDLIVVGLPYNSDGSWSEMGSLAQDFAAKLQHRYKLPVDLIDERYTSAEAGSLLKEQRRQGIRNKKLHKEDVDALAAQLIAESWMNSASQRS